MKVLNVNGASFLVEDFSCSVATKPMSLKGSGNEVKAQDFVNYVCADNLGELEDMTVGNAITQLRGLTITEQGMLTVIKAAAEEAEKTALKSIVNSRLRDIMGKM
jgi:hypothetical protein